MRDLSECKAEIRRQIDEKEKKRSALNKRLISSLSVCTAALVCFCVIMIVPKVITNHNTVYISSDEIKKYDSLEGIVNDSDLVFIGTVQNEHILLDDGSAPENVKTEYDIVIERLIIGDCDDNTVTVTTCGGTVNNVNYALKGSEKYVVGEKYLVFLSDSVERTSIASSIEYNQYAETSPLFVKIHINGNRIDAKAKQLDNTDVGRILSTKNVDELVQLIQTIKEKT